MARGTGEKGGEDGGKSVPYWRLFSYADRCDAGLILLGTLGAIVNGLTFPAMLAVRSQLINHFGRLPADSPQMKDKVTQDSLLFVYVALVALLSSYLEVSCWMLSGERQAAKIRVRYLKAILRQNVGFYDADISTANVVNSVSSDTLLVQEAISEKAGNFIRNFTQFLGGFLVAFTQTWKMAVIMLPFTPLLIMPGAFYGKAITDFEFRKRSTYNKAGNIAEQAISCIRTVYSFVSENQTLKSYSASLEATVQLGLKQGVAKGLALGANGISFALWGFMAWYGGILISHGQANGGQIITTGVAVLTGGRALGYAISNMKAFSEGRIAAHSIFRIIDRIPPIDIDNLEGRYLARVEGRLTLINIDYSYASRPDVTVLKGFNLDIPPGKTVALVGSSGSGKSTIISLLERFYDPCAGEILLDGVDIKELQLRWLRKQIGLVSQEPALFATSIKENILYGKEDASMDEVIAAAKSANAHQFIMAFPNGYDTQVGERGVQMSGGQKQRIAIARAMISNPPILLLDEATSALDSESETIVQAALEKASVGRTTVVVAHRLSTIRNADIIVVMQSGKMAEMGKHDVLVASGGAYAALIHLQQAHQQCKNQEQDSQNGDPVLIERQSQPTSNLETDVDKIGNVITEPKHVPKSSFWRLVALNRPEWKQGIFGIAGAVGFGLVHPVYAYLLGSMVSIYYNPNLEEMKQSIKAYSLIFMCLTGGSFLVNVVQHYNFAVVGELLTKRVREKMIATVLGFEIGWFDQDKNSSGAICSRLSSDANMVRALISDRISLLVQTVSAVCVSFVFGLVASWRMGLLMIGLQPLFILCFYIKLVFLKGFTAKAAKAQQEASQVASEAVSQHRTISAFSSQNRILCLLKCKLETSKLDARRQSHIAGFGLGIAQFVLYASWGLAFWYGGMLVHQGKATFGDVFKTFFVLVSTGRVLAEAGSLTPDLAKGAQSIDSVFDILDRQTKIDSENSDGERPGRLRGNIELSNVYFYYPSRPEVMIFRRFNLVINAGQTVALVGQSGSGKSTIIGLVERFYDPVEGQVRIDGKNLKDIHLKSLRKQIGLVSQEPILFSLSLRENIAYGQDNATEAEIMAAARAANAHTFISSLPDGYSTFAGERGLQLSGGQKQRIAIARAILKNPSILLLDEATSALDIESERLVQDALDHLMVGRTTIVVAHRLSTIQNCNVIAVIQNGMILEQGMHHELLKNGGAYSSLVNLQSINKRKCN